MYIAMANRHLTWYIRQLAHRLSLLSPTDPFRLRHEKLLLEKCYDIGLLGEGKKLSEVENKIGVSRLCRRRLGVVMTRLSMCPTVQTVRAPLSIRTVCVLGNDVRFVRTIYLND